MLCTKIRREGEDYVHSSVYKTDHDFQALCSFDEWLFVCMWASVSIQIYISVQHGSTGHSLK